MKQKKTNLKSGINPNTRKVNGAVVVFDNGGWVDDIGVHHGRRRSHYVEALGRQLSQGRLRAKIVLSKRQLAILDFVKVQGSASRSSVALGTDLSLAHNVSTRTLTRDLVSLVRQGLLNASGKLKHTQYSVVT